MTEFIQRPNLAGVITKEDVSTKGTGNFKADYRIDNRGTRVLPMKRIRELFELRNGILYRDGQITGSRKPHGYWYVTIDSIRYSKARVVYALGTGIDPGILEIDHIDRNPDNNNFSNLRAVTGAQNKFNQGLRADNTSGVKGVSWNKNRNKWVAYGYLNGTRYSLGYFCEKSEAMKARELWFESIAT